MRKTIGCARFVFNHFHGLWREAIGRACPGILHLKTR
ncbi:helix-turn-helix domain-containing protein [Paenibacillus harenae]